MSKTLLKFFLKNAPTASSRGLIFFKVPVGAGASHIHFASAKIRNNSIRSKYIWTFFVKNHFFNIFKAFFGGLHDNSCFCLNYTAHTRRLFQKLLRGRL